MPKEIFIASSRESVPLMREVSVWVEEAQCTPICWDNPDLFLPGDNTFLRLQEIAKTVDGAILIFGEDDKVWYRGDTSFQPRDNVLVEYGLFAGLLGQHKAAICISGDPKAASDLAGITVADLAPARRQYARRKLLAWLNRIDSGRADPAAVQMSLMRRQLDDKEEEINFLRVANADLLTRIAPDDQQISIVTKRWRSLFTFSYVWGAQQIILKHFSLPAQWKTFLDRSSPFPQIGAYVSDPQHGNPDRLPMQIRKALRVLRIYFGAGDFDAFLDALPTSARAEIEALRTWRPSDSEALGSAPGGS